MAIDDDFARRFPNMRPISSPPPLFRINGCGPALYGRRDADPETGTYVATLCLSLLFIPVLGLRAYRVARAENGGWYFVGREPLSMFARGWNLLLVFGVVAAIAVAVNNSRTSTPDYLAKQQMDAAGKLAAAGQLAEASKAYERLAVAKAEQSAEATTALRDLVDNRCPAAPLTEAVGVYTSALNVGRKAQGINTAELPDKALALVAAKGDADPAGGVAVLDVVRPLVTDTRAIDDRRLALLRLRLAAAPGDLDAVVPLAALLLQQDQSAEAKALLVPHRDKLGDGEGARVLGLILGREGEFDAAYALLWAYVQPRLDKLHAAESTMEGVSDRLVAWEMDQLKRDKGPADFYAKYKAAPTQEAKGAVVREYVQGRLAKQPEYAAAQEALARETAVVPVALELGIVTLQRAQSQADPAARKAQLEAAEKVFLAVGGVAAESDAYRTSLGQVYYRLGRQAEGRKLFDEYLAAKGRTAESLVIVAGRMREVGSAAEARTLAEEAYGRATKPQDKHDAAGMRAAAFRDLDDRIDWLNKSDLSDPRVAANLAKSRGDKAAEQGRDDEAAGQYRQAIDAYKRLPRGSSSLNDLAIAYGTLFYATGDAEALRLSVDHFQQAVDLEPGDPILLGNAGHSVLAASLADVVGGALDLRALRDDADVGTLGHLYNDGPGRDAVAARVRAHPGATKAVGFLEKVTVLAPRSPDAFMLLWGVYETTRNDAALDALEKRLRDADVDLSDHLGSVRDHLDGTKDEKTTARQKAGIAKSEALAAKLRPAGGKTAAAAIAELADRLMSLDELAGGGDADRAVALATEAHKLSASSQTVGTLRNALLARAVRDVRKADPAAESYFKQYARACGGTYALAAAAATPGPLRDRLAAHADVKAAIAVTLEDSRRYPDGYTAFEWALLRLGDPAAATEAAANLRQTSARRVRETSLSNLLVPGSGRTALNAYWLAEVLGKPEDGKAAIKRAADLGVKLPVGR